MNFTDVILNKEIQYLPFIRVYGYPKSRFMKTKRHFSVDAVLLLSVILITFKSHIAEIRLLSPAIRSCQFN